MEELPMPSINQVALSGRVIQDPNASQTENSQFHLIFIVAVERPYRDEEGTWHKETTTVPIRASGKLAEYVAARLCPGKAVFLTGRLSASGGANSRGSVLEVIARHIQFLGKEKPARLASESVAGGEREPCDSSLK